MLFLTFVHVYREGTEGNHTVHCSSEVNDNPNFVVSYVHSFGCENTYLLIDFIFNKEKKVLQS